MRKVLISTCVGLAVLAFALWADSPTGWSLVIQNAGTTLGATGIFNCSTGLTCALAGGAVNVTASGSAISTGGYSALPGSVTNGNMYRTTDSPYEFIGVSGVWNAFMGGYGLVVPPGTLSPSWVNQGTATETVTNGVSYIAQASGNSSNHNWSLREIAIPNSANPYTITAVLAPNTQNGTNNRVGIGIRDGVGAKFITIDYNWPAANQSEFSILNWTNATTYGGTTYANYANTQFGTVGMKIQNNGTNVLYSISKNQGPWFQIFSHATGTFVTPTQVFYGISNFNAATNMFVYSFNLTQP